LTTLAIHLKQKHPKIVYLVLLLLWQHWHQGVPYQNHWCVFFADLQRVTESVNDDPEDDLGMMSGLIDACAFALDHAHALVASVSITITIISPMPISMSMATPITSASVLALLTVFIGALWQMMI
jgi:hypothetical protein